MFCICCEFNRNFFPTFVLDGFKSRKRKRNVWHFLLLAINYLIRCKFSVKIVIMLVNRAYTKTNHFDICVVFCLTMHGTVLRKLVSVSKASTLIPEAFFYSFLANFATRTASFIFFIGTKRWEPRKESHWSRSFMRISLWCWLSTWQLSKMLFSFEQSHPQIYLIHPIIWLVEQLKMSSNQKRRSKADGMKVSIPTVLTRGFLFLSARCFDRRFASQIAN